MTSLQRRSLLALGALAGTGIALSTPKAQTLTNIADTLAGDSRFSRFLNLIVRASSTQDFREVGPLTVFAPVDQAFAGAPAGVMQDLLTAGSQRDSSSSGDASDRDRWLALINYHVVPGAIGPMDLKGADRRLRTRNGRDLQVSTAGDVMSLRNPAPLQQIAGQSAFGANFNPVPARQAGPEIIASNGVIYPIDQILWP